jgi:hypothetical protein
MDVSVIAQVTAAVVAALRAEQQQGSSRAESQGDGRTGDNQKGYSEFQLAKLKGFSGVRAEAALQPIWTYFKSTKEVDAQRTQLLEDMKQWARQNDVQIHRNIYFDKATMDDITKMEFGPGTPTAFLSTAEQGISILTCRPRVGNETADIRTKEHAMQTTRQNHSLAEALLLGKRDPRPPAATFQDLKLDLGTFCALLWVLFGEKCDYFDNCFALFSMLDSESVTANSSNFTPTICRQITWAVLNDGRQFFFRTVTVDNFATGQVRWPTSLLMQIIGADVHACREIRMGNFPEKWQTPSPASGSGVHAATSSMRSRAPSEPAGFPPPGLPPYQATTSWREPGPQKTTLPETTGSASGDRPVHIRQTDIHPLIKNLMTPYISHFRSIQLRNLLRAANISEGSLPTIPKYLSNGRNNMCYSYVLGKCQGRICGRASGGHVPVSEITDEFASSLCNALAPGVEKRLATEPAATYQSFQQHQASKRQRRST